MADGQVSEHALAWLEYEAFRQRYLVGVHAPGKGRPSQAHTAGFEQQADGVARP